MIRGMAFWTNGGFGATKVNDLDGRISRRVVSSRVSTWLRTRIEDDREALSCPGWPYYSHLNATIGSTRDAMETRVQNSALHAGIRRVLNGDLKARRSPTAPIELLAGFIA